MRDQSRSIEDAIAANWAQSRRHFFLRSGAGLGAVALAQLLGASRASAMTPRQPHYQPKAKRVIYLHMVGAPSQLDLYDPKPELQKWHGKPCPDRFLKGRRFAMIDGGRMSLIGSPYTFGRYGKSGAPFSELLPYLSGVADELAFIKSMRTDEINHAPAQLLMHAGFGRGGRPSLGAWLSYGLGSINEDLPTYVTLVSGLMGGAGTALWSSGFLPSAHQGTRFRSKGDPVLYLGDPKGTERSSRRRILDAVRSSNADALEDVGDPEIATRIEQYELAFRMQMSVPELMDIHQESPSTLEDYGAKPGVASFANNCLLARRLVERGARIVELYDSSWDHHSGIFKNLPKKCRQIDRPIAALISDLKQRGLLEDTLIVWGSEFGRTPLRQGGDASGTGNVGRDHHIDAFTVWLAGAGVKPGVTYGASDEFGFDVAENPVHVHDLNATLLHLMGIQHKRLTYHYQGRDFRLTDVHGQRVWDILA